MGKTPSTAHGWHIYSSKRNQGLMQGSRHFLCRAMYLSSGCFRRFYYAKGMEVDEAYVFVCYNSRADRRARFTPHTGDASTQSSACSLVDMRSLQMHSPGAHAFWSGVRHQQWCHLDNRQSWKMMWVS